MDFDLIQKLIRLANNNPNEHEANLAARKACKMLDGHSFGSPVYKPTPRQTQTYYGRSPFEIFINDYVGRTVNWTGFDRGSNPFHNWKPPQSEPESGRDWRARNLKCKKCGKQQETKYRGLEENFMCWECRGKKNMEREAKKRDIGR